MLENSFKDEGKEMRFFDSLEKTPLKYLEVRNFIEKNIDEIQEGVSQDENFLYFRLGENIKVYDRVCDHNGGKLSLKGKNACCPLHGWELDISTGIYTNARFSKKTIIELNEYELDSPIISIPITNKKLCGKYFSKKKDTEVRFLNHACLIFTLGEISFATDPWLIGSAFCNGWWLAEPSPEDSFDQVNKCDFIYISHNHPDHLHTETLGYIRKDMPILTADFVSESTKNLLQELQFDNILAMDFFSALTDKDKEISLSVLKSGDFRDDSGLFVQNGQFKCLLTVDSNFLDFARFPQVDLLCSSFAGGASGFPLCFENYTDQEKKSVVVRNRGAIKATNSINIKATKAKYFMPYASFFVEAADRDLFIKERNIKNSIKDFEKICDANGTDLINVETEQIYKFRGSQLIAKKVDTTKKMSSSNVNNHIKYDVKKVDKELSEKVLKYFEGCDFEDDLFVELLPTNDEFSDYKYVFQLDFRNKVYKICDYSLNDNETEKDALANGLRYLKIKVRKAELLDVISYGKSWEDLSIGFQCRIYRKPNIYNSEFWFYFTNIYIGKSVSLQQFPAIENALKYQRVTKL